jgi:hypothetical protein
MPVFTLWSTPRARSAAFFRSMLERGDVVAVHLPFYDELHAQRLVVTGTGRG